MFKGSEYHEDNNCLTKVILTTYDATVNQDVHTLTPKLSRIFPVRTDGQGVVSLLFQGCLKFDEFNRYISERLDSLCFFSI